MHRTAIAPEYRAIPVALIRIALPFVADVRGQHR